MVALGRPRVIPSGPFRGRRRDRLECTVASMSVTCLRAVRVRVLSVSLNFGPQGIPRSSGC